MMQTNIVTVQPHSHFPFSSAVIYDGLVYVSGQVGFKAGTTELVAGNFAAQCRQTFLNIDQILAAAGTSRGCLLRCNFYLRNCRRDFDAMNAAYVGWIGQHRPARTTIGATFARLGILVEMDCIAALPAQKAG
jgi:2-iminobutanoate/2-iminopropanoate deaminase